MSSSTSAQNRSGGISSCSASSFTVVSSKISASGPTCSSGGLGMSGRKVGSLAKPPVFSSANVVPGTAAAQDLADLEPDVDGDRPGPSHLVLVHVVHDAAVGADREAVPADVLPEVVHPADRPAGDEHDRDAELLDRGQHLGGCAR